MQQQHGPGSRSTEAGGRRALRSATSGNAEAKQSQARPSQLMAMHNSSLPLFLSRDAPLVTRGPLDDPSLLEKQKSRNHATVLGINLRRRPDRGARLGRFLCRTALCDRHAPGKSLPLSCVGSGDVDLSLSVSGGFLLRAKPLLQLSSRSESCLPLLVPLPSTLHPSTTIAQPCVRFVQPASCWR